jgi:hypothetical protein
VSAGATIGLRFRDGGSTLEVTQDGAAFQRIDTTSYVISPAATPDPPVTAAPPATGGGGLQPDLLAAIVAAVLAGAAAVVVGRRGRLPAWRPRSD